ncbi:hypothetical protein ACA910_017294 [Epithemia clementina (nom. ined.)]
MSGKFAVDENNNVEHEGEHDEKQMNDNDNDGEDETAPETYQKGDHDDDDDEEGQEGDEPPFNANAIENLNEIPVSTLRAWNATATLFQLGQAGALFYLATKAETNWFIYTNFPTSLDDSNEGGFGVPKLDEIAGYSVSWYSGAFLALSGLNHLSCLLFEPTYHYYLERSQNPFRWFEYSLSASLMRVMIAQLSGVADLHLLFTIFVLSATTMLLGAAHESTNAKARADGDRFQNWFAFWTAWLPHLASWAVIFSYFFYTVANSDESPPTFVWSIVIILFVLDATFALLFWWQWNESRPDFFDNYINGEIGFILLSFTSKAALAWINYFGGSR